MSWIQLNDGTKITYYKPQEVRDNWMKIFRSAVASISQQVRFQGHTYPCLTVAEHSMVVAAISPEVVGIDEKDEIAIVEYPLRAMLHDLSEAFFSDIPGPAKEMMYVLEPGLSVAGADYLPRYVPLQEFMARFDNAIGEFYGLEPPLVTEAVDRGDKMATASEARVGLTKIADRWTDKLYDKRVEIPKRFLERYKRSVSEIVFEYATAFRGYKADVDIARRKQA